MKNKLFRIIGIALIITLVYTYPLAWIFSLSMGESRTTATFTTEGIGKGLTPKGGHFDINQLKSTAILEQTIWDMGLQNQMTASELAQRIRITPYTPGDALSNLTVSTGLGSVSAIYERRIYANQFSITLEDGGLPSPGQTNALLDSMMENYRSYLEQEYLGSLMENTYDEAYLEKVDYPELMKILLQQADTLIHYVEEYVSRLPEFRSYGGIAFSDLLEQTRLIRNVEIRDMQSLVTWYALTKNPTTRKTYEQIALERAASRLKAAEGQANGLQEMVDAYDNTTNYIFPQEGVVAESGTKGNEYYGALAAKLIGAQRQSIDIKYEQEQIRDNIAKIESGSMLTGSAYDMMTESMDQSITGALDKMQKLRQQVEGMVKEYYADEITPKIKITSPRYQVNAWGNPVINFVVILMAIGAGIGLYHLILRKRPFFDKLEVVREKVKAIRKGYEKDEE